MNGCQYLVFLAVQKAIGDLKDETVRPTRAVASERRWRRWRPRHGEQS
jgi:hypothetical protein